MYQTTITDIAVGVCCCFPYGPSSGVVVTGNSLELVGFLPAARTGDITIWPCGVGVIIGSTTADFSSGPNEARTGDITVGCGCGVLVNGSHGKIVGG